MSPDTRPREPQYASHVILMRVAQADDAFSGPESERPLDERGRAQARASARAMHGAGHHPGPLLAAASLRARETAAILAAELQVPDEDVQIADGLFDAGPELLEARIRVLAKPYTLVTLIADNPGLTDLARFLASDPDAPVMQPAEWRYLRWPPPD